MPDVEITTFGYRHSDPPPAAHLTLDLREHFRDPHVSPEMRHITARDEAVRTAVRVTPGIQELVDATAAAVMAFLAGPSAGVVTVAVGCAGGQHRAPVVGEAVGEALSMLWGVPVAVTHRDLDKAVVSR